MKKLLIILFALIISVPVILPFFHSGYFPTHDGEWAVVRLGDMFRTLRDFQIPARYSGNLNFGYGYPLFNFAYPFPYYLGLFVYFLGFGFVGSIKFIFAASVFFSAFFMFLASRSLWKSNLAGVASAVLYIYFPYRMVDLYVRGSIGESLSFVLFPLLIYLSTKLITKPSILFMTSLALSTAFLVMTHNIMTVLFLPFFLIFTLSKAILENKRTIKPFILSILLGLGLSAFFWIPAIVEKSNVLLFQIPIADRNLYFINFNQLIYSGWGYGTPTDLNGFSYQMGFVQLGVFAILILLLLFFAIKRKYFKLNSVKIASVLTTISLFFAFLLFQQSSFLWKNVPLLSEINYPWINLGILGFIISLLAGFLSKKAIGKYLVILFTIIAIFTVLPYAKPQYFVDRGDNFYLTNEATTTSSNELMPLWVRKIPIKRSISKIEIIRGIAGIANVTFNSKSITFSVDAKSDSLARVNTIYYPGWKATIDSAIASISYANEMGVMDIHAPLGKHVVKLSFGETNLRLSSDIISAISFLMVIYLILRRKSYGFS